MAARGVTGLRKAVEISRSRLCGFGTPRRKPASAFAIGAAIFVALAAAMVSDGAFAGEPDSSPFITIVSRSTPIREPLAGPSITGDFIESPVDDTSLRREPWRRSGIVTNFTPRRAVCVRLCDGFFFPVSDAASQEAACASLCPDAPTAAFYLPGGSERIEDAVSALGRRYGSLPAAFRYRSTRDKTCACRHKVAADFDALNDPTLREGDAVMTPNGFLVFHGDPQAPHTRQDFTDLADSSLSDERRAELRVLERGSVAPWRGAARSSIAEAAPAPRPARAGPHETIHFVERVASAAN
jgi:hypothetical protein